MPGATGARQSRPHYVARCGERAHVVSKATANLLGGNSSPGEFGQAIIWCSSPFRVSLDFLRMTRRLTPQQRPTGCFSLTESRCAQQICNHDESRTPHRAGPDGSKRPIKRLSMCRHLAKSAILSHLASNAPCLSWLVATTISGLVRVLRVSVRHAGISFPAESRWSG
jgi:hypothetical protein